MRGRKPKPHRLKLIMGNPGKRALTADDVEPLDAIAPPPEHMSETAREEWHRVIAELFAMRIITRLDLTVLAAYCEAYAIWKEAKLELRRLEKMDGIEAKLGRHLMYRTKNGNWVQTPLIGTMHKAASDMVRYAAEFGMTPSSRERVSGGIGKPKNKFDGLFGARKA